MKLTRYLVGLIAVVVSVTCYAAQSLDKIIDQASEWSHPDVTLSASYVQVMKSAGGAAVTTKMKWAERQDGLRVEIPSDKSIQVWNPEHSSDSPATLMIDGDMSITPPANPRSKLLPSDFGLRISGVTLADFLKKNQTSLKVVEEEGPTTVEPTVLLGSLNPLQGTLAHIVCDPISELFPQGGELWIDVSHGLVVCYIQKGGDTLFVTQLTKATQEAGIWLPAEGKHSFATSDNGGKTFSPRLSAVVTVDNYAVSPATVALASDPLFSTTPPDLSTYTDRKNTTVTRPISPNGLATVGGAMIMGIGMLALIIMRRK